MKKEIDFPSSVENVRYVENLIDEITVKYKVSSEIYGNILVSIVEAVNNAIIHGNKLDPKKAVHVTFSVKEGYFTFNIKDQGNGYNIDDVPDPTLPENIEDPHGRGIFLMKNLADEINYYKNGAEIELKFKIK